MRQYRKSEFGIPAADIDDAGDPCKIHGCAGCDRNTADSHAECRNQRNIKHNIGNAGYQQKVQRCPAVAHTAENAGIHVVADRAHGRAQNDPCIQQCLAPYICRNIHDPQNDRCREPSENTDRNTAEEHKGDCRAAGSSHCPVILRADMLGDQNADGSTDAEKDAQKHLHRLGACADRRNCRVVAVVSDDQRINRCIEILKNVSRDDRQRKQDDAAHDRPAGHVYFFHL